MQRDELLDMMKKSIKVLGIGIFLLLCTVAVLGVSGYSITQINLAGAILFGFSMIEYFYFKKNKNKKNNISSAVFAGILTVSLIAGRIIRDMDDSGLGRSIGITDLIYGVGIFLLLFMTVHNLFSLLDTVWITKEKSHQITWKFWLVLVILMLICWLPYTITFFPGIIGSDPVESVRQALGIEGWTNHHPILYTAYIKLFIDVCRGFLGIIGALGLMIIVQQMIFAAVLSYCLCFMWKRGMNRVLFIMSVLFVTVNPVVAIFSVYATKDVLYSSCVLLFMMMIYEYVEQAALQEEPGITWRYPQWILFGVISLLVIFLRNNGSFLVLASLLVLLCKYRKKEWRAFGSLLVIACLSMVLQKQVLFPMLQVEEGSFAESLSIPLQQVAQVVVDEGSMTSEQEIFVSKLLPLADFKEAYQAGYTDPIKFHEDFDDNFLNDNKMTFVKVWFGMLPHNLGSYVKAYLLQTAGYWDITQTDSLTIYGVMDNEFGIIQCDAVEKLTGHSLQPIMEKLILVCRKAPVLCYLTNMAMMLFFSIFLTITICRRKKGMFVVSLVPLFMTWITIMIAAPASCKFRYLLPFYLAWPFMIWMFMNFGILQQESVRR